LVLALVATAEDKPKGTKVTIDGLTSTTPANWEKDKPANTMREMQFKVPKVKGDSEDAEVVVFKLGGTPKQNLERWKGQFDPPEGKKLEDVSTVEEFKVADCPVTYYTVTGIYYDGPPMLPKAKKKKKTDWAMLICQIEAENSYQIRLIGPAATVKENKKDFETWIKGFKK
jgi:hypothetical protein